MQSQKHVSCAGSYEDWHYPKDGIEQMGTPNLTPKDTPGLMRHNLHATKCCSKTAPFMRTVSLMKSS